MSVDIRQGDCLEVMADMADNSIDAIVTDPPYGLGFMGKEWDALPPGEEWARECLRVLKPGGHLLAFGGSRTWHRLAVAVEDAGFEIRDSIAWLYGSGFPKSHNVGKATGDSEWQGWGTALKPAFEPVVVARKPLAGTVAANVLEYGTGALNIDGCRVGDQERVATPKGLGSLRLDGCSSIGELRDLAARGAKTPSGRDARTTLARVEAFNATVEPQTYTGRWPANVVLDESQAAELDKQSGTSRSSIRTPTGRDERGVPNTESGAVIRRADTQQRGHADSGGASRFFYTVKEQDECATAMESAHQTTGTGAHGARHAGSTTANSVGHAAGNGDTTTNPRFFYVAKAPKKERPTYETDDGRKVAHPTVKPLALIRWLVRLVTPPGGVVLDPFAGSGTTVEAAILEGVDVVAIEREADYLPLIEARVRRALDTPRQGTLD